MTSAAMFILENVKLVKENENDFMQFKNAHSYSTRNCSNIQRSTVGSELHCDSTCTLAAKLFNRLPKELKKIDCRNIFVRKTKEFLMEKAYYTVREFLDDESVVN